MLGERRSEVKIGCDNPQKQHNRRSVVQTLRTAFRNIPLIDWACPLRFLADPNWKMEAGSESKETHIQLQRESRTAEAIYRHNSDIPPNPYVAPDAFDFKDGSRILVIPLDAINDGTSPNDPLVPPGPIVKVGEKTTQPLLPSDEVIGTAVALVAFIKSREPGSQIDFELLIKLLCNPGMLEKLTKEHGLSSIQSTVFSPTQPHERSTPDVGSYNTCSPSAPFTRSLPQGVKNMIEQIHGNSESQNPSFNKKVGVGELRKLINEYGLVDDSVKPGPDVVKDAEYYRRLISLHGMVQQNDKTQGSVKPTGVREQKPCVYFSSPKGCRLGSGCRFQHVNCGLWAGGQVVQKQHSAKRMKLSGGIFARHT